jgi:hypothetical protein
VGHERFLVQLCGSEPFDVEVFFDSVLKGGITGVESLNEEARAGLESFSEMKMTQLKAYDNECATYL